jgi:cyclopropane fatty-acyl-phospholipid synthase-like methyltransferase
VKLKTDVVLLRGINVGGKNKVPMSDLKKCLEELGFPMDNSKESVEMRFNTPDMDKSRVKKGYNQIAGKYSLTRDQFKNRTCLEKFNSLIKPHSKILDLGCGSGKPIDEFFINNGQQLIGLDISEEQVRLARENFPQNQFEVKDMDDLREGEYMVDAVVSFYAIFHIPREKHLELFKKINSFLPVGGFILVTMGASDWEGKEDFYGTEMHWSHY